MKIQVLLFLVVSCFLVLNILGANDCGCPKLKCTDCVFTVPTLSSSKATLRLRTLVKAYWSQAMPKLSCNGKKFRQLMWGLAHNGTTDMVNVASMATILLASYTPFLNQLPNVCSISAAINGSVMFATTTNPVALIAALPGLLIETVTLLTGLTNEIMVKAGCDFRCGEAPPDPLYPSIPIPCFDGGFTYDINTLLNLTVAPITSMPPAFKTLLLQLYDSYIYMDNMLAFTVSAISALYIQNFFTTLPSDLFILLLGLLTTKPVKPQCCLNLISTVSSTVTNTVSAIAGIINGTISAITP